MYFILLFEAAYLVLKLPDWNELLRMNLLHCAIPEMSLYQIRLKKIHGNPWQDNKIFMNTNAKDELLDVPLLWQRQHQTWCFFSMTWTSHVPVA